MTAARLKKVLGENPAIRAVFLPYARSFVTQVASTAVANGRSSIEARLARWLLMVADRMGQAFRLPTSFCRSCWRSSARASPVPCSPWHWGTSSRRPEVMSDHRPKRLGELHARGVWRRRERVSSALPAPSLRSALRSIPRALEVEASGPLLDLSTRPLSALWRQPHAT